MIAKAKQQGVPVIDYDRLTLGGGASYYVSFDNVAVGTAQGEGLVKCMKANGDDSGPVALLNGSPTDNNATLFKQGYEKAIKDAGYTIAADQSVPDWDNTKAGTIFEQMFTKANGKFVGVDSANDGLGGAVAQRAQARGRDQGHPDHRSGRDRRGSAARAARLAVHDGLQGDQEGGRRGLEAGDRAGQGRHGRGRRAGDRARSRTPRPSSRSRACCCEPQAIFPENVKDVVADGFTTADKICTTEALKKACEENGVSG